MDQGRMADTSASLSDVATHFIVHCPKCDGKALVDPHEKSWRLRCTKCFHVEQPGHWYGDMTAYASVKCRECHEPIRRSAPSDGEWKKIKMVCDNCGDVCEYEAHVSRHLMHEGLMTDSVFGLPLWLQTNFRNDLFWSFNYEHLKLIEDYVRAKLRERGISPRNSIRKNSSLFARLPGFITKAGNREELLKMIGELQVK